MKKSAKLNERESNISFVNETSLIAGNFLEEIAELKLKLEKAYLDLNK